MCGKSRRIAQLAELVLIIRLFYDEQGNPKLPFIPRPPQILLQALNGSDESDDYEEEDEMRCGKTVGPILDPICVYPPMFWGNQEYFTMMLESVDTVKLTDTYYEQRALNFPTLKSLAYWALTDNDNSKHYDSFAQLPVTLARHVFHLLSIRQKLYPSIFAKFNNILKEVHLTRATDDWLQSLTQCQTNIQKLCILTGKITDFGAACISNLQHLKYLSVDRCFFLTDQFLINPKILSPQLCSSLTHLIIRRCLFTLKGLETLHRFSSLVELKVNRVQAFRNDNIQSLLFETPLQVKPMLLQAHKQRHNARFRHLKIMTRL